MISTTALFADRYQLGPLLGQGGMSDVYRAVDQHTGASVAVKIVRSGDPELARRLAQEVRVHERMEHPGLIRLLSTGLADGQAYLVMELIEGTTLATSLRAEPLGARLTAKLGGIIAGALDYVHEQGIVHRDVKPANIMLGADGRALLGDFGIARLLNSATFTLDGTTLGTAAYMAPEQLEDHQVGPSADIWSLGMVLLECLTGRRVYDGTSSEIIGRRLAGPVPLPGDLPVPWKLLLSGMLDHRPEQRLSGEQVASLLSSPVFSRQWSPSPVADTERVAATVPLDLTALAPGEHTAAMLLPGGTWAGMTPPPPAPAPARPRRAWWIVLAVLVVAALGGGLAYGLDGPTPAVTHPPRVAAPSHPTTTSTASTTTTTIAPALTAPTALAALVRDVAAGVDGGTLSSGMGQAITTEAQQAVSDEAAGKPNQAADDLQQVAATIAAGEQNSMIPPSEGALLQGDLSSLANTLGLSAASTPPSTPTTTIPTTTTAPAPAPGPTLGSADIVGPGAGHRHPGAKG